MNASTMKQELEDYCRRVYPKGMSEIQRKELHQCWFACALVMIQRVSQLAMNEPTPEKFNALAHDIEGECISIAVAAKTSGQKITNN